MMRWLWPIRFYLDWRIWPKQLLARFPLIIDQRWFTFEDFGVPHYSSELKKVTLLNPDGISTTLGTLNFGEQVSVEHGGILDFCAFIDGQVLVRYTPPNDAVSVRSGYRYAAPLGAVFFLPTHWREYILRLPASETELAARLREETELKEQIRQALRLHPVDDRKGM